MKLRFTLFLLALGILALADTPGHYWRKIKEAKSDTALINAYNGITSYYIDIDNDSADHYNRKSLDLSTFKQIDNSNFKGFLNKAELQNRDKKYQEALETVQKATDIANRTGSLLNKIEAVNLKGVILHDAQQGKAAYDCYKQGYDLARSSKNERGLMISALHCGMYFKELNDITSALSYFTEAYPIAEQLRDTNSIFACCINMGTLYERTKDNDKALQLYRKALSLNGPESKDENAKAICYFKIGRLYSGLYKTDSAEYYLGETRKIHQKRNDERGLIFDYSYLATLHIQNGEYDRAHADYDTAMILAQRLNDSSRIGIVYTYLGTMYDKMNNLPSALACYQHALQYRCHTTGSEEIMNLYGHIADIYSKQGKYKEAYENEVLYKTWADSSHNINEMKKQTEIKLAFEFRQVQEKMQADADAKEMVAQAMLDNERLERYLLFAVTGIVAVTFFWVIGMVRARQKINGSEKEHAKDDQVRS